MKMNDILMTCSIAIMIAGFCVYLYFLFYSKLFFKKQEKTTPEKASTFGEFINGVTGPLFALAGFMIIYSTIMDQKDINKTQQFENYFFKFLDYHRSNNEKIAMKGAKSCNQVAGRQVWVNLRGMVKKAYHIVEADSVFSKLNHEQKIDLSYAIVHYGLGTSDTSRLYNHMGKYTNNLNQKYVFSNKLRQMEHCAELSVYFYGFSNILDNYFQEYFTYLNYVDECDFINDKEKLKYVNILNAQNDIYCNAVIYFYLHSSFANESQKNLVEKYGILEKIDKRLIAFDKEN
jgi:hypothetical protein